jgi:hypothetical protein
MNEKEKYRAKMEARMSSFNQTITEITNKAKRRKATQPDLEPEVRFESLVEKQNAASAKLKELEKADDNNWKKFQAELDQLVEGIDQELRRAMTYFG